MANKKIFTGYTFSGGGQSVNLRLESRDDDPTNVGKGHAYYNATAGTIKVSNANAGDADSWKTLLTTGSSIAASQLDLTNVDAVTLDGKDSSATADADKIPIYGTGGVLPVATPTEDGHAASKGYVDSAIQGLNVLEPCRLAQTFSDQFKTKGSNKNATYANNAPSSATSVKPYNSTITADANGALSVDGVAVAVGDRILVRWQGLNASAAGDTANSEAYENGIYDVTATGDTNNPWSIRRARSGSSDTVIGDEPSKEYRTVDQMNKGDFVFITAGTENINDGWIMTSQMDWDSSHRIGISSVSFTQFSGAGQITAGDGLAKSGDTLSVDLASGTPLQIDSNKLSMAAIGVNDLADDAVTAAKLDDDASFTMGGLTVNGDTSLVAALPLKLSRATYEPIHFGFTSDGSNHHAYLKATGDTAASPNYQLTQLRFGVSEAKALTLTDNNKIGIGADATAPSGTLHVSTARYGSAMLTGDSSDFSVSDETASTSVKYGWASYGSNKTGVTNEQLVITYVNHDQGAFRYFKSGSSYALTSNLTVGKSYKVSVKLKYSGSGTAPQVRMNTDGTGSGWLSSFGTLTTSLATYTETFVAGDETDAFLSFTGFSSGQTITVDDLEIYEDFLSNDGTLSVNAAADDLVIANNASAGMTIMTPTDGVGGIFFADKNHAQAGGIYYTHGTTNSLTFTSGGYNSTALTLNSDRTGKFDIGLGVGALAGDGSGDVAFNVEMDRSSWVSIIKNTNTNTTSSGLLVRTDSGTSNYILAANNNGTYRFGVHGNGNAFFNGGNVAIGGTTANSPLTVHGGSHDAATIEITNSANSNARLLLNSGHGNWSVCNSDTLADALEFRDESADSTRLLIDSSGTQDHKANSIINSATVAGLQDGACYDFDGTDDWIDAGSGSGIDDLDKITISAWVKFEGWGESNAGRIVSKTSTANTAGWTLYANNSGRIGLLDTWTTTNGQYLTVGPVVQLNKWYHIAVSYDRATAAQAPTFYVNGTVATYDSANSQNSIGSAASDAGSPLLVGARRINSTSVDREFDGQIRDVKIFPSALDAADIRKLYSGENPKKNTNVELTTNSYPSFTDSGWTKENNWEISGGQAVASAVVNNQSIYRTVSLTTGKTYKATIEITDYSAGGVKFHDLVGHTPAAFSSNGVHTFVFTANAGQDYVNLRAVGTTTLKVSYYSIIEVGTLVDFTPQSASSSKWRNEAIPALYNGTVNNATLSQGNSYWNNIKQDGSNIVINPTSTAITNAGSFAVKDNVDGSFTSGLSITRNNADQTGYINMSGGAMQFSVTDGLTMKFRDGDGASNFEISPTAVKVTNKLGIGADADTNAALYVNGDTIFNGTLKIDNGGDTSAILGQTSGSNSTQLLFWDGTDAYLGRSISGLGNGTVGSWNFRIAGADQFIVNSTGIHAKGDIAKIERTDNAPSLQLYNNHASPADDAALGYVSFMGKDNNGTANQTYANIGGFCETNTDTNVTGYLSFRTTLAGTATAERLRIKGDGTQDHKANRIVNSQTLNDSWRSSEPSLKISGNNKVVVPTTVYDVDGGEYTFIFRVKRGATQSTHSIIANGPSRYYDKIFINQSGTTLTIESSTNENSVGATLNTTALDNKWHEYAIVTNGDGSVAMYQDGVALTVSGTLTNDIDLRTIGGAYYDPNTEYGQNFEINSFRIHNRKLEADEIKGYYNGDSTPHIYSNALATNHATTGSTWYTGSSSSAYYLALSSVTSTGFAWDNTADDGRATIGDNAMTLVAGKRYRLQANINRQSGSGGPSLYVRNTWDSGTTLSTLSWASGTNNTLISVEFTCPDDDVTYALNFSSGGVNAGTVSNISLQQIGEVAAYTPKSINDKWYDTTSNANHGTITGAAKVGDNDKKGTLNIKGYADGDGIYIDNTAHVRDVDFARNSATTARMRVTEPDATKTSAFNFYTSTGSNGLLANNNLRLNYDGAVTATSASGGLKQVARTGTSTSIGLIDGDGSKTHFSITHNLGTELVVVSIREKLTPFSFVETEVRCGSWSDNSTMASNSQYDKVTVIFATAPAANEDFYVTVIG